MVNLRRFSLPSRKRELGRYLSEQYEIIHYRDNGKDVYQAWLDALKDIQGQIVIARYVARLAEGNFGNSKSCGEGVSEVVIDYGPGYRVYYSVVDGVVVLLLCGGPKKTQKKDIARAIRYLRAFREEKEKHGLT